MHAKDSWYIRPAIHYYCCYKFWLPETQGVRISKTENSSHHTVQGIVLKKKQRIHVNGQRSCVNISRKGLNCQNHGLNSFLL